MVVDKPYDLTPVQNTSTKVRRERMHLRVQEHQQKLETGFSCGQCICQGSVKECRVRARVHSVKTCSKSAGLCPTRIVLYSRWSSPDDIRDLLADERRDGEDEPNGEEDHPENAPKSAALCPVSRLDLPRLTSRCYLHFPRRRWGPPRTITAFIGSPARQKRLHRRLQIPPCRLHSAPRFVLRLNTRHRLEHRKRFHLLGRKAAHPVGQFRPTWGRPSRYTLPPLRSSL
mmetsp:Transcript_320/g.1066  ORF Transcript_320/g.1066 Transcript_320/m.1066 type:complete len:229 (+) Transcript_320:1736-2422(+)